MRILVTGVQGQLGFEIKKQSFNFIEHSFFFECSSSLDITNFSDVKYYIKKNKIEAVINCAAYTLVDKAEKEIKKARLVNSKAVENLAFEMKKINGKFIHISTDYVFSGSGCKPYKEDDLTKPINIYGKTKREGEELLIKNSFQTIIIRTSWLYSNHGKNFLTTIIDLAKNKTEINVVFDQISSPTYAYDLAKVCLKIISSEFKNKHKIYHYSNQGVASWYDFAKEIINLSNIECKVIAVESLSYKTSAKRPYYSVLNNCMIKKDFNIEIPYWRDSLKKCISKIKDK